MTCYFLIIRFAFKSAFSLHKLFYLLTTVKTERATRCSVLDSDVVTGPPITSLLPYKNSDI